MNKIIQYGNGISKLSYEDRIELKNLISDIQSPKERQARRHEGEDAAYRKLHPLNGKRDRYGRPIQ